MTTIPPLGDDVPDDGAPVLDDTGTAPSGPGLWSGTVLDESKTTPRTGLWGSGFQKPPPHVATTRREIARWVVYGLVLLYGAVIVTALFKDMAPEQFTAFIAGLSGLSSLAAAVIGFYFGQASKSDQHKPDQ